MKRLVTVFPLLFLAFAAFAQTDGGVILQPQESNCHKFFLKKPVKSLIKIETTDGEPLKGKLAPNGEVVILLDYKDRKRVKATVEYEDGTREEIQKSTCDIFEDTIVL